ncbi:MAG: DMT family transporter [Armatimonadota bacterium]
MSNYPIIYAITAAVLFGISAPIAKLLLGQVDPVPLAGLLYLGSGVGLLILNIALGLTDRHVQREARLTRRDMSRVFVATLAGGVAAPIVLMYSLRYTPAATASLLLTFEGVATVIIARIVYKEPIGRLLWIAMACITTASVLLSVNNNAAWGISLGALGVLAACILWGVDNNLTNTVSAKNPVTIVIIKGLGAGVFSLALAVSIGSPIPQLSPALLTMALGFFTYGLSIVLFIRAMRDLGAARASAYFGTAPFIGSALSFVIFRTTPSLQFLVGAVILIAGTILLSKEEHDHEHIHSDLVHEHKHIHDEHHQHSDNEGRHNAISHQHTHKNLRHRHKHTPDIHHRHEHE